MSDPDLSIWELCDDPDAVAGAIAAADQYRASLRDAPLEKVEALSHDSTLHHFARMLAVREIQRRVEAANSHPVPDREMD